MHRGKLKGCAAEGRAETDCPPGAPPGRGLSSQLLGLESRVGGRSHRFLQVGEEGTGWGGQSPERPGGCPRSPGTSDCLSSNMHEMGRDFEGAPAGNEMEVRRDSQGLRNGSFGVSILEGPLSSPEPREWINQTH